MTFVGRKPASGFRARARLEADRYGPDPWIFVRELLQNARDAGATRVELIVEQTSTGERVICRDDGEGMSYEHARRYLFSLYASSKESNRNQVGKFGVGFWSILRFEPQRILIASAPTSGKPWQVTLEGSLDQASLDQPALTTGTEVILERGPGDGQLDRRIRDAAHQNARFVCTRDDPQKPLLITVNGNAINEPFTLPPPFAAFSRGRVRGVIGLGTSARVELFSRGLRVRSASSLSEFLSAGGRHTDRSRVQFTELPGRLAPQALLESDALELLLSRSDAREDRTLRRLITLAQRELERLITRQIDAAHPLPLPQRLITGVMHILRTSLAWRLVVAALIGATIAALIAVWLWREQVLVRFGLQKTPVVHTVAAEPTTVVRRTPSYHDLARTYQGPQVDVLDSEGVALDLRYEPTDQVLRLAALIIENFDERGHPQLADTNPEALTQYVGTPCSSNNDTCTSITMAVDVEAGVMRIPIPTGHRLDTDQVELDGVDDLSVFATSLDEPVLVLPAETTSTLRYVTVVAPPQEPPTLYAQRAKLPPELEKLARNLRRQPLEKRVKRLTREVSKRVRYSISPEVARRHGEARDRGQQFFERALEIGAGDCDVQNGLLVSLLQHARVPARLAVGYVGRDGRPARWLHAWVEYRDKNGLWKHADASSGANPMAFAEAAQGPSDPTGEGPDTGSAQGPVTQPQPEQPTGEVAAPTVAGPPSPPPAAKAVTLPAWVAPSVAAFGMILVVGGLLRRRTRRDTQLDNGGDLSRLLQGALLQPDAFRSLPALYQRPLIPLLGGRQISLERALGLAASSALFRSGQPSKLAGDAHSGNVAVLDARSPEARTVADTLGAVDLDMWDKLMRTAQTTPLLEDVNAAFASAGERWTVRVADGLGSSLKSLDLGPLRLRRSPMKGTRLIVLDRNNPSLIEAAAAHSQTPRLAVLRMVDMLTKRLDLAVARRAVVLGACAKRVIREGA